MSRALTAVLPVAVAVGVGVVVTSGRPDVASDPVPAERRCGVALGLFASEPDYDYALLLDEVADVGATDVLLSVPWVQADVTSSHLAPMAGQSPSDATLERTIAQARDRGLAVGLMPVVRLEQTADGVWRGALQPADRGAWFAAYGDLLRAHAELADRAGVDRLVVASELSSLEADTERWRPLIADVRQRFGGTLTWSANWDRFEAVELWDALDEVGVSAWFELGDDPETGWSRPKARLRAMAEAVGKPIVLTEVGYPARSTAALRPWDHTGPAQVDVDLQAELFELFVREVHAEPAIHTIYVWNWFGLGGHADAGYSPRGRPAAGVLKRAYTRWCGASSGDPESSAWR